ncbi:MAG: EAL domain-containing protein [Candidatus Nucleicultricaceae bacterium]
MQKSLFNLLGVGLISFCFTLLIRAHLILLTSHEMGLLAGLIFFGLLFFQELYINRPKMGKQDPSLQYTVPDEILKKLEEIDQHRIQLREEIDNKINELIRSNLEKFEHSLYASTSYRPPSAEDTRETIRAELDGNESMHPSTHTESTIPRDNRSTRASAPFNQSPQNFFARDVLLERIQTALKNDKIETLLQPIVSLPQRKKRFFEATSRLRDQNNAIIMPEHYIPLAEEVSLIRIIDNAILMKCIYLARSASKKDLNVGFFLNLSLKTLEDTEFINSLSEFMEINHDMMDRLIFCLEAKDMRDAPPGILKTLQELSALGCQFALTHVTSFDLDFKTLRNFKVRFIKINHAFLQDFLKDTGVKNVKTFKHHAYLHQVDLVVTHVESEEEYTSVMDFECDFGQGYLFGYPDQAL